MDKRSPPVSERRDGTCPQVFYIDGCKVTVRYSSKENPSAVKSIKGALLSCSTIPKK